MKKRFSIVAISLLAVTIQVSAQVSNDNEDEVYKVDQRFQRDFVPGQVLVKMKDGSPAKVRKNAKGKFQGSSLSQLDAVLTKFGVEEMEQLLPNAKVGKTPRRAKAYNGATIVERDLSQLYRVVLPEEKLDQTLQLVEQLETLDVVEYAEPNYKAYLTDANIAGSFLGNPFVTQQWYLDDYGVKQLWNKPIVNSKRPVIAILDTGVDMTHPDLAPNLWTNTAEADGEEGYDNDGNGFTSDVHGWDFINNTPNVRDYNMHGTHVAGIAAAANNGIGIVGANPQALIMPVSVMQSDGTGDVATIIQGINYAVQNGADILNLSLGTYTNSNAFRQALERAYQTTVIVAAAGNDALAIESECNLLFYAPLFPAAYSFVLGVQATTNTGGLASFSNYDCNGPNYSASTSIQEPDGFNYELKAPGTNMLSTVPGGKYKVLNGTSMAAPLVAGAISALKMVKQYDTQEILWGDLLHTDNIAQAYNLINRPAELDLIKIMYRERKELTDETEADYSNDGEIDAGETISLYPVIRTTFGGASNIKLKLEMGDLEDPNTVQILTTDKVDFGMHLDAYGKGVSLNPLQLKIADNVANGRHIKMKVVVTCDETNIIYEGLFTMIVTNTIKLSGAITEDMVLSCNHKYYVQSNLAIMAGVTLTIEPGTVIKFAKGVGFSSNGKIIAEGTPEKSIIFSSNGDNWGPVYTSDVFKYCRFEYYAQDITPYVWFDNCTFINCNFPFTYPNGADAGGVSRAPSINMEKCNVSDCVSRSSFGYLYYSYPNLNDCNFINNIIATNMANGIDGTIAERQLGEHSNIINTLEQRSGCVFSVYSTSPKTYLFASTPYFGTSKEELFRPYIVELGNGGSYAWVDLTNLQKTPYTSNHGIVWKVVVNGKDAQDEYEDLAPLGVGKHKFEVYFNRAMNKAVAPKISFGVRDPWTQNAVAEDGSWNEAGTIYTAYVTITGKTKSDGINRIYVYGAEDDEYFEIPYEKTRFNIIVQAAGSMATGFAAEAGLGRVTLSWDNSQNNFEDAMGFNIYRYTINDDGTTNNAICINQDIVDIETTEYTDYDVVPGTTYYYMYKVLSTDLQEYDVSNVVAVTPQTSTLGDANGSGDVDVADVITTVNYASGQQPKPFIFEAADMNADQSIDILDVIGIIKVILNPDAGVKAAVEATATYTIEDGTLYVETPVALAGVQVQLAVRDKEIRVADDLNGFEQTSVWLSDNDFLFLAYNLNGKTLMPGKHALLHLGNAKIGDIRLSDADGHNVKAIGDEATRVNRMATDVMNVKGIYDMQGRKLTGDSEQQVQLPKGVYIVNGKKVVK
ncbi:MAG: S8 family serine peptidase [Bacteroidaceae bacterium]|nr:S8 family serine peptidase [Bacteroidaceae bacterium]